MHQDPRTTHCSSSVNLPLSSACSISPPKLLMRLLTRTQKPWSRSPRSRRSAPPPPQTWVVIHARGELISVYVDPPALHTRHVYKRVITRHPLTFCKQPSHKRDSPKGNAQAREVVPLRHKPLGIQESSLAIDASRRVAEDKAHFDRWGYGYSDVACGDVVVTRASHRDSVHTDVTSRGHRTSCPRRGLCAHRGRRGGGCPRRHSGGCRPPSCPITAIPTPFSGTHSVW